MFEQESREEKYGGNRDLDNFLEMRFLFGYCLVSVQNFHLIEFSRGLYDLPHRLIRLRVQQNTLRDEIHLYVLHALDFSQFVF